MALRPLFATPVYESSLSTDGSFENFRAELEAACRMLAAEDVTGQAWCKANGYGGYTSYASLNDLPRRASIFDGLERAIARQVHAFARELQFDLGGRKLKLDSLWINVMEKGAIHAPHIHPHSVISGTVYVRMPRGASAIRFEDPRLPMMMGSPMRRGDAARDNCQFVYETPKPGTVLMWESWLRHEVPANRAKSERITVSFNYRWG